MKWVSKELAKKRISGEYEANNRTRIEGKKEKERIKVSEIFDFYRSTDGFVRLCAEKRKGGEISNTTSISLSFKSCPFVSKKRQSYMVRERQFGSAVENLT